MDLSNNFLTYNDTVLSIFRNSGKDYNDFGRFEDCKEIRHFNYYMLAILNKFPVPFGIGLCVPKECTIDDLNEFKPFLTKVVNSALPNMFEDVVGFNTTKGMASITEDEMHFYDSAAENAEILKFNFLSASILIFIVSVCLMTLISTFILWNQAKEYERKMEQRSQRSREDPQVLRSGSSDGPARRSLRGSFASSFASTDSQS